MITWDLILCSESFLDYVVDNSISMLEDASEWLEKWNLISKHHIVISDNLMNAYAKYAAEVGKIAELDSFRTKYAADTGVVKKRRFLDLDDEELPTTDIDEAIISAAKDELPENPIVICNKCERCHIFIDRVKPTKTVFSQLLGAKTVSNPICRNTTPFTIITQRNDNCSDYENWFRELFHSSREISIFDRFLMKNSGFESLKLHYLPTIPKGTKLQLFTDYDGRGNGRNYSYEYETNKEKIDKLAAQYGICIILYKFDHFKYKDYKDSYHERYIIFDGGKIHFPKGLDILPPNSNKIQLPEVSIKLESCDYSSQIKEILREYPGYQIDIDTSKPKRNKH